MALPSTGDSNWGVPLNQFITDVVLAEANSAAASIATHVAGGDPHGDRAYAQQLVTPLTSGVNGPSGFLQLNSIGKIPNGVLPAGGGRTSTFDVGKDYIPGNVALNGATGVSTYIQKALNDCQTAGGGEVWVGDGNYGIDSTLFVPSNCWLHLSPGATMTRIVNLSTGQAPVYMLANFSGSSSGSGSGNILIEGGQWVFDGPGAAGSPMAFIGGSQIIVRATTIRTLIGSPAIIAAGMSGFGVQWVLFSTATPGGSRASYAGSPPAVRVENAASNVIPGLNAAIYSGSPCTMVAIGSCAVTGGTASDGTGLYSAIGGLAGTTSPVSGSYHTNISVMGNAAVALPGSAVYAANWKSMTVLGNQFNVNNGSTVTTSWSPSSAPAGANQDITNNGATDTWHDMRPLQNSFIGTVGGQYPPQYRISPDGSYVQVAGFVQLGPSSGNQNSLTLFTMPPAYRPTAGSGHRWLITGVADGAASPIVQVDTSGNLQFHFMPASGIGSTIVGIAGEYPLDSSGLIPS